MNKCVDCKHYSKSKHDPIAYCLEIDSLYDVDDYEGQDAIIETSYAASLIVTEKFGCTLWQSK